MRYRHMEVKRSLGQSQQRFHTCAHHCSWPCDLAVSGTEPKGKVLTRLKIKVTN